MMTKNPIGDSTRIMHESQEKWVVENWNNTLVNHTEDVEKLVNMTELFNIWTNILLSLRIADRFIPEIFMDSYISIHFAGYGLYKYAHTCLRSQLESTLRLIYFSKHEVEYGWWSEGSMWFRDNKMADVWGRGYGYFRNLRVVKDFNKECPEGVELFGSNLGLGKLHRDLSQFIHSGADHFQTGVEKVSPAYETEKFHRWKVFFKKVQESIHVALALGFPDEFKKMGETDRSKITNSAIGNSSYKQALDKLFPS
jgi:hypothetical protein